MIKKIAYSFGAIATALSYQAFSTYIIFFYVDVMKLPPYLAGVAMLIYALWNAINDPLMGFISDNTHTRFGRRIPYLAAGAIPFGIVFFLLWVPPFGALDQVLPLFLYFLVSICVFDGIYTVTILNWSALYPEMFFSLRERAQVNEYRQTFGMLGLLLGVALPPLLYTTVGWGWMGAIFGVIVSLVLIIALWGSHENKRFSQDRPLPLLPALTATLENRSFLTFVIANLFIQYALTIILATIPFFSKYVLDARPQTVVLVLATAFLTAMPMLFVWRKLTEKFGAKYCLMASMALLMAFLVPLFYVQELGLVLLVSALIGSALAGFLLVADVIISDVIDEDEINTGTRREGMFFGMNAFITRFAIGIEALSMSAVFIVCGYSPYVFTQAGPFKFGLRLLMAGFPMVALALGLLVISFYPLAGKKLAVMRAKMAEIHRRKGITPS